MLAPYLVIALGGSLGAVARYTTVMTIQSLCGLRFPYGTLVVNTLGAFIGGFLLHLFSGRFSANEFWRLFLFTGFLGAYTTFSSFAAENLMLFRDGQWLKLSINILMNNVGTLITVFLGALLAEKILVGINQS